MINEISSESRPCTSNHIHIKLWDVITHPCLTQKSSGPRFNINMTSCQFRKSHCGDKTILRPSYLHNGISHTGKTTSLYWIRALVNISEVKAWKGNYISLLLWNVITYTCPNHKTTILTILSVLCSSGIILWMCPANVTVTSSPISWAHTQNDPWELCKDGRPVDKCDPCKEQVTHICT